MKKMRVKLDEMSTIQKVAIIVVVCCIGLFIIGAVTNVVSPDQNTNSAPQTNIDTSGNNTNNSETSNSTNSQETYTDGTYKVGTDIPAGEYKFTQTSSFGGYIERARDSSMELDSIISNEATSEEGETVYVTINDGEYLKISGGELVKT